MVGLEILLSTVFSDGAFAIASTFLTLRFAIGIKLDFSGIDSAISTGSVANGVIEKFATILLCIFVFQFFLFVSDCLRIIYKTNQPGYLTHV
jgi:hypothetical protein